MFRSLVFVYAFLTLLTLSTAAKAQGSCLKAVRQCTRPGLVALTFDDGVTKNYPMLLNTLDQVGVKATFFIEGQVSADKRRYPQLVDAWHRGHDLGNHTWTHARLIKQTESQWKTELELTERLIFGVTGYAKGNKFMRPPHGEINEKLCQYITNQGNTIVLWNIELTADWQRGKKKRTTNQLWSSFERQFRTADPKKDSFIFLQHDKSLESVGLVPTIVKTIRDRGFKIVSLTECLKV